MRTYSTLHRTALISAVLLNRITALTSTPPYLSTHFKPASLTRLMSTKTVLVPIADGSEEIETSCITDVLTRFGASVTTASCNPDGNLLCVMSRNLKITADTNIEQVKGNEYDLIAIPGGMPGAETLRDSTVLKDMLLSHHKSGRSIGAVCAAPAVVLSTHDILPSGSTCYPAPKFMEVVEDYEEDESVVVKGNVVTSKGPGTSLAFALKMGENLFGKEEADRIRAELLA
mmetsp:Transcript_21735/g.45289  ORF Transcript_21735/g.45289 Transcript_21735/m.45289 type:complete len:230 (-) Transcript_21735:33-722(-)